MTNLDALKSLYAAIGGDPADVAALNSNTDVLNAIAAFYGAAESAASNAAALMAIAQNYDVPEPVLEALNVTANGDYTPDEGVDGFSSVRVDVEPATVKNYIPLTLDDTATASHTGDVFRAFGGRVINNMLVMEEDISKITAIIPSIDDDQYTVSIEIMANSDALNVAVNNIPVAFNAESYVYAYTITSADYPSSITVTITDK